MSKVFVEYAILDEFMPKYRARIVRLKELYPEVEVLEGADQPGLFVEIWNDSGEAACSEIKRRLEQGDEPIGGEWTAGVKGGRERIRVWHFREA